jgi:transcription elongation factor Elf1
MEEEFKWTCPFCQHEQTEYLTDHGPSYFVLCELCDKETLLSDILTQ